MIRSYSFGNASVYHVYTQCVTDLHDTVLEENNLHFMGDRTERKLHDMQELETVQRVTLNDPLKIGLCMLGTHHHRNAAFYCYSICPSPCVQMATSPEQRAKHPWIITMAHRPMYCSNPNGDTCNWKESRVSLTC